MQEELSNLINTIKNPNTGKSLESEGRIVETQLAGDYCTVAYRRDGINPSEKRLIEEQIISVVLKAEIVSDADNIKVRTISENSDDVYKSLPKAAPKATTEPKAEDKTEQKANLTAGHGPTGSIKKRVPNVKKVYAISSGKGGVGKSTVCVNLAMTLSKLGHKVGIIDADIYGPSTPMLLGKRDSKPLASKDKKILPVEAHGISFISFGLFVGEKDPVIWRGPMLGGVLNQFLFDVDWGELDYLLIDMPPGTGDMQLSLSQLTEIDGAFVVTTPQDIALLDSRKGLEMFLQIKIDVLGIIENMSYFVCDGCGKAHNIFGKNGAAEFEKETKVPVLGNIPLLASLREASDAGVPFMSNSENEGSQPWKSYIEMAKKIAKIDEKKSFLGKLFT